MKVFCNEGIIYSDTEIGNMYDTKGKTLYTVHAYKDVWIYHWGEICWEKTAGFHTGGLLCYECLAEKES